MLQIPQHHLTEDRRPWETASAAEFYSSCIGFLRRRLPILILFVVLGAAAGVAYIFLSEQRYTGRATLIIETPKVQLFQSQPPVGGAGISSATVDTQLEILNSDDIASSVIKELRLDEDPEFVASPANALGAVIRFGSDGAAVILQSVFAVAPSASNPGSPEYRALQTFHKRLKVKRVGVTYAIEINFESRDAYRAAQVANAVADAYELNAFQAKYQITGRAAQWLQDRIKELREEASNAERAVVAYKTKNNIVDTGGRLMNQQQLAEFNTELIQARAATAESKAKLDRVQELVASGEKDPNAAAAATVADNLHNEVITKLRTQYLDYERRVAEWSVKYGAGHMAVVTLRNQMAELRHNIFEELKRTAESYKSDYAIAKAREDSLQQSLNRMTGQSHATDEARITLRNLEGTAQTSRDLYDNFLQRYMQSIQQQSSPVSDSRLVTHARPPLAPSSPRPFLILAIASLGGLVFGAAAGMLRDISDRVFRTTKQIGDHLQVDCIAVIPRVQEVEPPLNKVEKPKSTTPVLQARGNQQIMLNSRVPQLLLPLVQARRAISSIPQLFVLNRLLASPTRSRRRRRRRTLSRDRSVSWMVANAPFSRFSESIRAVKVAADIHITASSKSIGVTSALPNEGKTTVALSLAAVITQGGGRAILVDCDLRNPALSSMLTPDAKRGLLEVITGKAELADVIWREPTTGLAFLPAVLTSPVAHSSDILASKETRALFETLRGLYDYVIVDLSPLAPVVDARVTTALVDSFLFVVEWGSTKIDVVQFALANARGICTNLLGIVLNKADMKAFGRYANEHSNYYSNSYYGRYGYTD